MVASRLLDSRELAAHLSVSPRTVEKWTQQRSIPFVRLSSRCIRYRVDEIEEMLAERHVPVGGTSRRSAP